MNRRGFLRAAAVTMGAAAMPIVVAAQAAAYTTRQLVRACRLWLKRHHVKGYATVTIIPGDGPPPETYLEQGDSSGSWRWAPGLSAWVGPAYNVSWSAGASIPPFYSPFAGQHVQLYVGDWLIDGRAALADLSTAAARSAFGPIDSYGPDIPPSSHPAAASGSGVAFVVQAQSPQLQNLIANPSFETGTTGWSAVNGTVAQTDGADVDLPSGTAQGGSVLRVDSPGGGGGFSAITPAGTSGMPVVGQAAYRVRALIFVRSTDTYNVQPGITLAWYNAAGALLGGGRVGSVDVTDALWPVDAYTVAPPDAAYLQIQLTADSVGSAAFAADLVQAVPTANPPDRPTQPLDAGIDVLALIGSQVTASSTFTFPPEDVDGAGVDGDYWLDKPGAALYGPKDGQWPDDPAVAGFNLTRLVR